MKKRWFVFTLPGCTSYVPAIDEKAARGLLRRTCYVGAPVDAWPLVRIQEEAP